MKKTFIKLFIVSTMLFSAFIFAFLISSNVYAEEVETTNTEPTTQEQVNAAVDENQENTNAIIEYFKTWTIGDIKGWIAAICAKLGIDTLTMLALFVYFIRAKVKEAHESEEHNKAMEKLSADHQKEIQDLEKAHEEQLEKVYNVLIDTIKKQNSEKREIAKNNVDEMRAALGEIKVNLDE